LTYSYWQDADIVRRFYAMKLESGSLISGTQFFAWGVFLGAWVHMGWVDWTEQKIRNKYLVFWLKFVLAGYCGIIAQSLLGEFGLVRVFVLPDYYQALLLHAALSAITAYALWCLRIWPAGDVKLFVLLSLCYPLLRIPGSFRSGLLFLEVLINIFVPAAAFLFLTAGAYLWRTRFAHYKIHFIAFVRTYYKDFQLPDFDARASLKTAGVAALSFAAESGIAAKREMRDWMLRYKAEPQQLAYDAASWLSMMAIMSLISYLLNDVLKSNVLRTLSCFALMFTWSRFSQYIGSRRAQMVLFCALVIILWRHPNVDISALAVIFGHISVFSLCIFLGMQLAFKVIAGKTGYLFLPLLMLFVGLIPWRSLFSLPWLGLTTGVAAARNFSAVPSELVIWALMGVFFGLALVFVRIWDAESYQSVPIDRIDRFMSIGPSLITRIEADEDFHDEHFSAFYADGLTGEQAVALREWCRGEGLETVPLAPTISFANWIFLGYFLTRLLEGHALRFLY